MNSETPDGGVAQLGEHLPCKQGVMGSNPIISTIFQGRGIASGLKNSEADGLRRTNHIAAGYVKVRIPKGRDKSDSEVD